MAIVFEQSTDSEAFKIGFENRCACTVGIYRGIFYPQAWWQKILFFFKRPNPHRVMIATTSKNGQAIKAIKGYQRIQSTQKDDTYTEVFFKSIV